MDITSLNWLTGTWQGTLGERQVEASWGHPSHGGVEARVRIVGANGIEVIELIAVREHQGTLQQHLRQYSPTLEQFNAQTLTLVELGERSAIFKGAQGDSIARLNYRARDADTLRIEVTVASGDVLPAELTRHSPD